MNYGKKLFYQFKSTPRFTRLPDQPDTRSVCVVLWEGSSVMGSPVDGCATYLSQSTSLGSVRSLMPDNTWEIRSLDNVPIFSDKSLLFKVKI
jgi:hypothetical protein